MLNKLSSFYRNNNKFSVIYNSRGAQQLIGPPDVASYGLNDMPWTQASKTSHVEFLHVSRKQLDMEKTIYNG